MNIICIKSTAECNRSYIILKFKAKEFKYKSTYLDGTCIIENFLIGYTLGAEQYVLILLLIQNIYIYKFVVNINV